MKQNKLKKSGAEKRLDRFESNISQHDYEKLMLGDFKKAKPIGVITCTCGTVNNILSDGGDIRCTNCNMVWSGRVGVDAL